jgi:hypothetical protein
MREAKVKEERMLPSARTVSPEVTCRLLTLEVEEGRVSGIALWFQSQDAAKDAFAHLHNYITASADHFRRMEIAFRILAGQWRFELEVIIDNDEFGIIIEGVDETVVNAIRATLAEYPYTFVAAGYDGVDGQPHLLPLRDYQLFRGYIAINGETVFGQNRKSFPIDALFEIA